MTADRPRNDWSMAVRIVLACLVAGMSVCCRARPTPTSAPLKVVRVAYSSPGKGSEHFSAWTARFETDNPGWTLQRVSVSQSRAKAFYYAAGIDNTLPDVVELFDQTAWLVDEGYLQPLSEEFYSRFGLALPPAYRGKRYGTGGQTGLLGLAVNRDLWRAAGATGQPLTWAELGAGLRKIDAYLAETGLDRRGYRALAWGGRDWSARIPLELALRVDVLGRDVEGVPWVHRRAEGTVHFADDAPTAEVVKAVLDALGPGIDASATTKTYADQQALFVSGRAAAWFTGTWIGRDLESAGAQFSAAFYPVPSTDPKRATFVSTEVSGGGWGLSAAVTGEYRAKAARALEALLAPEVYQAYLDATGGLGRAEKVPAVVPVCAHSGARAFYASARAQAARYGAIDGSSISDDDQPPAKFIAALGPLARQMLGPPAAPTRPDTSAIPRELDALWEAAGLDSPE